MKKGMRLAAGAAALVVMLLAGAACAHAQAPAPGGAAAARAGALFVVIYRPGPAWREGVPMREQGLGPHARYIGGLMEQGRLFAGGGFDDRGGLAIMIAADLAEAEAMLAADPAIISGIFSATLEHWTPRFRTDTPLPG